jgi:hypothetical protein
MPRKKTADEHQPKIRPQRPAAEDGAALAKKLGVKLTGMPIALLWAPEGFAARLGIEEGEYATDLSLGTYDLILLFTASRILLGEFFPLIVNRLEPKGRVWISWPRKSEGQKANLTLEEVRKIADSLDMIEVQRCRIEDTWNGVKFKKGVVSTTGTANSMSSIAPYSISVSSSIPITPDPVPADDA